MKHSGIPPMVSVMTTFPYSVELSAPLSEASSLMRRHGIRHLPVTDQHKLVGIISDRDIAVAESLSQRDTPGQDLNVGHACTRDPYEVSLDTPLDQVVSRMAAEHIGSAVVTRAGKVAGIFTTTDACRLFGILMQKMFRSEDSWPPEAA